MEKLAPQPSYSNKVILTLVYLIFLLIPLLGFSQSGEPKSNTTTLDKVVDGIKEKNKSIKNAEHVNVMVNDKLVYNLHDIIIDPKSIALVEVLVLEPKADTGKRIDPSIIINTK